MKNLRTFEEFINEQEVISESVAADLVFTALYTLVMMSGPIIALGIRDGVFDDIRTPMEVIKDWKRDRIVSNAIEKLSKDLDIIEFLKLPQNKQRGKWKALVSTKLDDKELKHINSISRQRVQAGKL